MDTRVSVLIVTCNHVRYIRNALDGALSQRTDFPFEIVVGDDASTDGTREIIEDFARRYPGSIVPILQETNVGALRNINAMVEASRGAYVALCDGDDYWTDPRKLQKQADFLDARPDFSMCFHPHHVQYDDRPELEPPDDPRRYFGEAVLERGYFTIAELIERNFIASVSVMYRWALGRALPEWMLGYNVADYPLHLLHAGRGKIGYLDEPMAVYRRHSGGIWRKQGTPAHDRKYLGDVIAVMEKANSSLGGKYDSIFRPALEEKRARLKRLDERYWLELLTYRLKKGYKGIRRIFRNERIVGESSDDKAM